MKASLGFVMENVGKVFEEDNASPGSMQVFDGGGLCDGKNVVAS